MRIDVDEGLGVRVVELGGEDEEVGRREIKIKSWGPVCLAEK